MHYPFRVTFYCLLITCLFVLTTATDLCAQKRNRQVVSIGPKVGVNLSNLHGDVSNQALQAGLSAGAILNYSVVNTFGISVEALFSQKGAKFENAPMPSSTQRLNFNRKLNYVEVPLTAVLLAELLRQMRILVVQLIR
jgi:hypothetical protein